MANSHRSGRWLAAGAGVVLMAGVQVALATPAAAVPGLTRVTATSGPPNSSNKTQTVKCPAGKRVLGGAGRIGGGDGQVGLDAAIQLVDGSGFLVRAQEDGTGTAAHWSLTAVAFCAPLIEPQYVSYTFTAGSTKTRWSSTTCPAGKQLVGFGARINNGAGEVFLTGVAPDNALTTVTATGVEDEDGYAGDWSATARATCANPIAGSTLVQAILDDAGSAEATTTITCAGGKQLHALGGEIHDGSGQVRFSHLYPTSATQGFVRGVEDETGYLSPWSVHAYALCAT